MATFNVLSFDGGGIRGAFTARLLARLCLEHPDIVFNASMFAGTSTGGIIALGLAQGMTPWALVELYKNNAKRIFDRRVLGGVWGSKYSNEGLAAIVVDTFGRTRLRDLRRPVLISSFDLEAEATADRPRAGKAKFFESEDDGDELVVDVALATSAAPTYFPSHRGYVDGGVVANNPAICAVAQAVKWGHPLERIRLLSLGTGISPSFIEGDANDWGFVHWAPNLVSVLIDGVSGVADYQSRQLLGAKYQRLDAVLPHRIDLDDANAVAELIAFADTVDLAPVLSWLSQCGWLS